MFNFFMCLFLLSSSGLVVAQDEEKYIKGKVIQGPYKTELINSGEVSLLKTGDAEFPVSLVLDTVNAQRRKVRELVDKYDVAGSDPKVESLFFYPVNGVKNLVVLVSWKLTSRGVGTYGTLYQVYAYEKNSKDKLEVNKLIRFDKNLAGIEGYQEGQEQSFMYQDAASIKSYIKNVVNK